VADKVQAINLKHSDLLYDYIKFHLGLYIATPPVLAIIGTALGVSANRYFQMGMIGLIAVYFVAGVHASRSIANVINTSWTDDRGWAKFGNSAASPLRRFMHHYLYWIGLILGLLGIAYSRL
jgi:hypothetical protein